MTDQQKEEWSKELQEKLRKEFQKTESKGSKSNTDAAPNSTKALPKPGPDFTLVEPMPSGNHGEWIVANYSTNRYRAAGNVRPGDPGSMGQPKQRLQTDTNVKLWKNYCRQLGEKCVFVGECRYRQRAAAAQNADLRNGGYAFLGCGRDYTQAVDVAKRLCQLKTSMECYVMHPG